MSKTELDKKVEQIYTLVRECERLAEETNTAFTLEISYGMGGTYQLDEGWNGSCGESTEWTWYASSQSC